MSYQPRTNRSNHDDGARSLSGIDSVGWFGLVRHLLRWQNDRVALLSARFAALDLPHDPFTILDHLFPTGS